MPPSFSEGMYFTPGKDELPGIIHELKVKDKKIVKYHHELIEVKESIIPDEKIERLVRLEMSPYTSKLNKVVGETLSPLDRGGNLETKDNI